MSTRALLSLDSNQIRPDSYNGQGSSDDSAPATPSKDKFREWTFPRQAGGGGGGPVASSSGTAVARGGGAGSAGPLPGSAAASYSARPRTGSGGIRAGSTTAARRPSVAARQSKAANLFSTSSSRSDESDFGGATHGRSSSVAHSAIPMTARSSSSPKKQRPTGSPEVRHRSNASILASPPSSSRRQSSSSSPFIKLSLPGVSLGASTSGPTSSPRSPLAVVRLVFSNLRRKSAAEVVYLVLFCGAIVVWAGALCGYGHTGPVAIVPASDRTTDLGRTAVVPQVIDVQIPDSLLEPQDRSHPESEYLADVHQREGDSSHDEGEDHFQASPLDPALEDENMPHVHHNEEHDSLWSNHDEADDLDPDAAGQAHLPHPDHIDEPASPLQAEALDHPAGPAIVTMPLETQSHRAGGAATERADAGEDDANAELAPDLLSSELDSNEASPSDQDESAILDREVAEAADPEALDEDDASTEPIVDDSLPLEAEDDAAASGPALHVIDADDGPGTPTALDELLDSAAAEEQQDGKADKAMPADALFRAPGTKNRNKAQRQKRSSGGGKAKKPRSLKAVPDDRGMKVIVRHY